MKFNKIKSFEIISIQWFLDNYKKINDYIEKNRWIINEKIIKEIEEEFYSLASAYLDKDSFLYIENINFYLYSNVNSFLFNKKMVEIEFWNINYN